MNVLSGRVGTRWVASAAVLFAARLVPCNAQSPKVVEYYKARDYQAAIDESKKVLVQFPEDAPSHYYLGLAYSGVQSYDLAKEQFDWVLTHSADPELRAAADHAVQAIESAAGGARRARAHLLGAAGSAALSPAGEARGARAHPAMDAGSTRANDNAKASSGNEEARRTVLEAEARITDGKLKILKRAQEECSEIDTRLRKDVLHIQEEAQAAIDSIPLYFLPAGSRNLHPDYLMRVQNIQQTAQHEIDKLRMSADEKKRRITADAERNATAWESSMEYIRSEMRHPGKNIQIVPQNTNPYVRNYVTYGDSEPDGSETPQVVPLKAKAQKFQPRK